MIQSYFSPLLFALLLMLMSVLLGVVWSQLAAFIFKRKATPSLFWIYFTGVFLMISLFAIVKTGGVTLLLLCPFFLLLLFRHLPQRSERSFKEEIPFLAVSVIVQYGLFLYMFSDHDPSTVTFVGGDFNVYFRAAQRVYKYGVEAYNFSIDTNGYTLPSMYHFGDIWLYALSGRLNHFQPTHTFLTAFTVLSTLFSLGLFHFIRSVFPSQKVGIYYLLVLGGAFSAFSFCMPGFISRFAEPYTLAVFNWGKVMLLSCCMIAVVQVLHSWNRGAAILLISLTGLQYINALPAFFGAYIFLLIYAFAGTRELSFRALVRDVFLILAFVLVPIVLQYKVFPALFHLHDNAGPIAKVSMFDNLSAAQFFKTAVNIFIGGWFQFFTLAPYILFLVIGWVITRFFANFRLKQMLMGIDKSFLFLFFLFVAGLCSWAITFPVQADTVQFFHNILAPAYCIFISLVLYFILLKVRKPILSVLTVAVTLGSVYPGIARPFFVATFDRPDWERVSAYLGNTEETEGKFIGTQTMASFGTSFFRKSDQYVPLTILIYKFKEYQNVSLVSPFLTLDPSKYYHHEAFADLQLASLGRYFRDHYSADTESVIRNFVKKYPFQYLTVSSDTSMPAFLRPYVSDSCVLIHSNTIVYRLNKL